MRFCTSRTRPTASSRRDDRFIFRAFSPSIHQREGPSRSGCWPTISRSPTAWRFHQTRKPSMFATRAGITSGRFDVEADGNLARRLQPRLRPARPWPARRSRRDESRQGRPGLCRRRAGDLGFRARRTAAGNPRAARPAVQPGLVRRRCAVAWRSPPSTPFITFECTSKASCRRSC